MFKLKDQLFQLNAIFQQNTLILQQAILLLLLPWCINIHIEAELLVMLAAKTYPLNFVQDGQKSVSFRHSKYKPKSSNQLITDFEETLKFATFIGLNSKKKVKDQKRRLSSNQYKKYQPNFKFIGMDFSRVVKSSITNRRLNYFDIKSLVQKRKRIDTFIKANQQFQKHQLRNQYQQSRVHSNKKLSINNDDDEQKTEYETIRAKTARQLTRREKLNKQKQKRIQQLLEKQHLDKEQRSKILSEINLDNSPEEQTKIQQSLNIKVIGKLFKTSPKQISHLSKTQVFKNIDMKDWNPSTTNQSSNINMSPIIISNISNTQSLLFEKQSFSFRPTKIINSKKMFNFSQRLRDFNKKTESILMNNLSVNKDKKVMSKSLLIEGKRPTTNKKQIELKINRNNPKCFQFKYKICTNKK